MKRLRFLTFILLVACACGRLCAQGSDAAQTQPPNPSAIGVPTTDAAAFVDWMIDIDSGWRVHDGDNPAWAQPGFDDSAWQTVELDDMGAAHLGWQWFRRRIKFAPGRPHLHLLVVGGEGTYALYINGRLAADTGLRPWFALKRPTEMVIILPDDVNDITLALRTHTTPTYAMWHLPLFLTFALGTPDPIENARQAFQSQRLYTALPSIAINLLLLLAAMAAFALYRSQRRHAEYLWLGLYLFLLGISNGLLYCSSAGIFPLAWNNLLADPLIYIFTIMQIQFTFTFAGQRVGRIWRIYEAVLVVLPVLALLVTHGSFFTAYYVLIEALAILPAALLLPLLLFLWYRKGNREAGWLILPSLFPAATAALYDVGSASIYTGWGRADFLANPIPFDPVVLQISDLGDLLFVLAIGVVMFCRFTRVSREQARSAAELDAAREIQQRMVPAALPAVAGYRLEAAYLPAQEVGGDFYQVILQPNGSAYVVVGDVSGKGLKAAMTGALAIGALRTLVSENLEPAALLARLNEEMLEAQDGGFITCLCAHIEADGAVTMANAGHLPPYRGGEEIACDSGLPLGITADVAYAETRLHLEPGDTLTLLSDGVVEAMNAAGELFGFERTQTISAESAQSIAAAAQQFGQEDDITVLTVARLAAAV